MNSTWSDFLRLRAYYIDDRSSTEQSIVFSPLRLLLLVAIWFVGNATAVAAADAVYVNGKIITVDDQFSIVEAIAVRDGKVSAVGSTDDVKKLAGSNAEIVDLNGRTVVPGFIDSHAHMDREGLKFILPSLQGARSIDDVLDLIAAEVRFKQPGEWIVTMPLGDYPYYSGGADALEDGRLPNRWDLDKVAPDNPVYIKGPWYYWSGQSPIISIANSYALRLAGITSETKPPHSNLKIGIDDVRGEPNGIFREFGSIGSVEYSLMDVAPKFSPAQRVDALEDAMQRYNAAGTTSIFEGHGLSPIVIGAYKDIWEQDKLTVRSHLVMSPSWDASPGVDLEKVLGSWARYASGRGIGDAMLGISGIHVSVADSIQDDIRKASSSNPGWAGYSVDGILPTARGSLFDLINAAAKTEIRTHAITYNAPTLEEGLSILEKVNEKTPIANRRFSFQHLTFVSEDHLDRLKALGVVVVVVPGTTIWKNGHNRTTNLSAEDANTYVPVQRFIDKGIPFAFATDNVPIEPLKSMWGAITRKDMATGDVIAPAQRISRADALRAFTINGAYLTFEEDRKGSLEVGKYADFAVLSADLLTVPVDDIQDIEVLMTVVGGVTVYERTIH